MYVVVSACVSVTVCVRERESERDCVCMIYIYIYICAGIVCSSGILVGRVDDAELLHQSASDFALNSEPHTLHPT